MFMSYLAFFSQSICRIQTISSQAINSSLVLFIHQHFLIKVLFLFFCGKEIIIFFFVTQNHFKVDKIY
jgi:hypothetical protein